MDNFGLISNLDILAPNNNDLIDQGDDHIRGIKLTLRETFPGFNSALDPSITPDVLLQLIQAINITATGISTNKPFNISSNDLDLGSNRISNLQDGVSVADAVNKGQLDASASVLTDLILNNTNLTDQQSIFNAETYSQQGHTHSQYIHKTDTSDQSITSTVNFGKSIRVDGIIYGYDDIFAFFSDARLKNIDKTYGGALAANALLGVYHYAYKTRPDSPSVGLLAQEVKEAIPEAVSENEDGIYSIKLAPVVAHLVQCVNELKAEIEALKGE